MDIVIELKPLSNRLIQNTFNKYKNNPDFCIYFTKEALQTISNELITIISHKYKENIIETKGIYNYFRKSFNYKCQDLYNKHKALKRNLVKIDSNDISFFQDYKFIYEKDLCSDIELDQIFQIVMTFLKDKSIKEKAPYDQIISMIYQGYTRKDITKQLDISESSFKRYRNRAIYIVKKHLHSETDSLRTSDNNINISENFIVKPLETIESLPIQYSIETNYLNKDSILYAHIILYKNDPNINQKSILDEEFCLDESHYEQIYKDLKKKLDIISQ